MRHHTSAPNPHPHYAIIHRPPIPPPTIIFFISPRSYLLSLFPSLPSLHHPLSLYSPSFWRISRPSAGSSSGLCAPTSVYSDNGDSECAVWLPGDIHRDFIKSIPEKKSHVRPNNKLMPWPTTPPPPPMIIIKNYSLDFWTFLVTFALNYIKALCAFFFLITAMLKCFPNKDIVIVDGAPVSKKVKPAVYVKRTQIVCKLNKYVYICNLNYFSDVINDGPVYTKRCSETRKDLLLCCYSMWWTSSFHDMCSGSQSDQVRTQV